MSPDPMSPADYRAFLLNLERERPADLPEGGRAARLRASVDLHAELLAGLEPPAIPLQMRHDSFLDTIYARAADAASRPLQPLLSAALVPLVAPEDTCWREVEDDPALPAQVAAALPGAQAPGWLWARIRADIQEQQAARRRGRFLPRLIRLAAAAVLVTVGLFGLLRSMGASFSGGEGTYDVDQFVFRQDSGLAITDRLIGGR